MIPEATVSGSFFGGPGHRPGFLLAFIFGGKSGGYEEESYC